MQMTIATTVEKVNFPHACNHACMGYYSIQNRAVTVTVYTCIHNPNKFKVHREVSAIISYDNRALAIAGQLNAVFMTKMKNHSCFRVLLLLAMEYKFTEGRYTL